jgi:hypothetical protein
MEHPPAFLGAADETAEIFTKLQQDEQDFSCGIRDEGSGGERPSRFFMEFRSR